MMADTSITFSDLNVPLSILKSQKTIALAYSFTFAFITCSIFLLLNTFSINSSTLFFPNNMFSSTNSQIDMSTIFTNHSTFLPNSSFQHVHNTSNKIDFLHSNHSSFYERKNTSRTMNAAISSLTSALMRKEMRGINLVEYYSLLNCDLYEGEWVRDETYPLYKPGSCSFVDEQFNCHINGRPDHDYHKLKWKPNGCTLPRLNGSHMLELLRGKRMVFVGDSLNRNMWESLVCILKSSVQDQTKVYEANGRNYFRNKASYSFVFTDYALTLEFFVSPFLVQEWEIPLTNGTKMETLRLDMIDRSAKLYKTADILIFNTGHWWTHEKTSKGEDYYQEGNHVYDKLEVLEAFRKALETWGKWIDAHINPRKTLVFFRGYSASHFSGGQWNSGGQCDTETEPITNNNFLKKYPTKMRVVESILKDMRTHISYLNITKMSDHRKDGHPSIYGKYKLSEAERKLSLRSQDCSHWCLPGVPDVWNELLYAELLRKRIAFKGRKRSKIIQEIRKISKTKT